MSIANSIKDKGFYYIPSFITENKVNDLLTSIKKLNKEIGKDKATVFYEGKRLIINDIYKFNLRKIYKAISIIFSNENKFFSDIASEILDSHYLKRIDYYSSLKSNKPIINWHNDISYSGAEDIKKKFHHPNFFKLRFFLYLTDVEYQNGSLAVIPQSHIVSKAIAKLLYENKISYKPHWSLNDFNNYINSKDVKTKLLDLIGKSQFDDFSLNCSFLNKSSDTNKFDINSSKGGLVIFDDRCFHRGSNCSKSERSVMRYIYSNKTFN